MPFKSKAQQRFMFAAEERGEIPEGTAKRWAKHTPNIKKLPERAKQKTKHAEMIEMAFQLGVKEAMEKAGFVESALGSLVKGTSHLWGPAAVGAYVAGPDNRAWGAGAGMAAGAMGKRLGRSILRNSQFMPEELSFLRKIEGINPEKLTVEQIQKVLADNPEVAAGIKAKPAELLNKIQGATQQVPMAEWAGRLGLAGAGGALVSKMGPGGTGGMGYPPPGYLPYGPSSYAAPAVTDMSSHYMGFTPNG